MAQSAAHLASDASEHMAPPRAESRAGGSSSTLVPVSKMAAALTGTMTGVTTGATGATGAAAAATASAAADAVARSSRRRGLAAPGVRGSRGSGALLGVSVKLATSTEWKPFSAESGT